MFILSIDIGNKTFGYCIMEIRSIKRVESCDGLIDIDKFDINLLIAESANIVGDIEVKYSTLIERTSKMKEYLRTIDKKIDELKVDKKRLVVIIEDQLQVSEKNRLTSAQVIYHFSNECHNISMIHAVRKNNIHFHSSLMYSVYAAKYKTSKTAAKNHTTDNFLYWLKNRNITVNIEKSMMQHAADAFMQAYAFLLIKCVLIK